MMLSNVWPTIQSHINWPHAPIPILVCGQLNRKVFKNTKFQQELIAVLGPVMVSTLLWDWAMALSRSEIKSAKRRYALTETLEINKVEFGVYPGIPTLKKAKMFYVLLIGHKR